MDYLDVLHATHNQESGTHCSCVLEEGRVYVPQGGDTLPSLQRGRGKPYQGAVGWLLTP